MNLVIIFLEKLNTEKQFFEARLKDGCAMLKLLFANQQLVDEELLEDERIEDFEAADVEKKNIPYEADGQTKVIDRHAHMQTSSGQWRKFDAYGNFFVNTSKGPNIAPSRCGTNGKGVTQLSGDEV